MGSYLKPLLEQFSFKGNDLLKEIAGWGWGGRGSGEGAGGRGGRGLRKRHSSVYHIYSLYSLIESLKNEKKEKKLFCCFVDFSKTFDSVWHIGLWRKLLNLSISGMFLKVL